MSKLARIAAVALAVSAGAVVVDAADPARDAVTAPTIDQPAEVTFPVVAVTAGEASDAATPSGSVAQPDPVPAGTAAASAAAAVSPLTLVDLAMAADAATRPDRGPEGRTYRWDQPTVTYRVDLPGYPDAFLAEVDAAIGFVAAATGIPWQSVEGDEDVTIVPLEDHNGGLVTATPAPGHRLDRVEVQLGCCRTRVAWEEIAQAAGVFGDHADSRSVFSQDLTKERAGAWDAWLLQALYATAPGADRDTILAALAATPWPAHLER